MSTRTGRGQRLLALALATGTAAVAAGAGAASAAPSATRTQTLFRGTSQAAVAKLVVTLPAPLASPLTPALPSPIELGLIGASGGLVRDGQQDVSKSTSEVAFGSLVNSGPLSQVLAPVLVNTITATLDNPSPAPGARGTLPPNQLGLALALGPQSAAVTRSSLANTSASALATGSLGSLESLGVPPALREGLAQITAALQTVTNQIAPLQAGATALQAALNQVQGPLQAVTCGTLQLTPVCQQLGVSATQPLVPTVDVTTLVATLQSLPAQVKAITDKLTTGAVLSLDGASASQSVDPAGSGTMATGTSKLATIDLLGGLVHVVGGTATATAAATGKPGGSSADATATLLQAKVDNGLTTLLNVLLNENGLTGTLLQGSIPDAALKQTIGTVNGAVKTITDQLGALIGLKVLNGSVTKTASPDGNHAEAHAAPAALSLTLPGLGNLVQLSVGAVDVTADRRIDTITTVPPTTAGTTPPTKAPAKPVVPAKKLAFTGAELPLTAGLATLLVLGAAGLARRRRDAGGSRG